MKIYFFLLIFLLMSSFDAASQPLAAHRWEDRLILLFSADLNSEAMAQQLKLLRGEGPALKDRDLLIYRISPGAVEAPEGYDPIAPGRLFTYYQIDKDHFTLILIGKDGGEKLRSRGLTAPQKIFDLIDTMPMRRAEMRRRREGGGQ